MGKRSVDAADEDSSFTPVAVRARHDGWTPQKQHDFIAALGESGCVEEACAAVRMSARSAYKLRARPDASTFRQAWDVALDYAIRRLGDVALSRALHGVSRPVFYQGEQIGERRHYDERLTMFLLRYRDPVRYGAWLDSMEARRHPDGPGIVLAHALNRVLDAGFGVEDEPAESDPAALPRALDQGPPPRPPEPPPYDGPEELRQLFEGIHAAGGPPPEDDGSDPTVADWRNPLTARRPRIRRL